MPKVSRAKSFSDCPICPDKVRPGQQVIIHFDSRKTAHRDCVFGKAGTVKGEKASGA